MIPQSVIAAAIISAAVNILGWVILCVIYNVKNKTSHLVTLIGAAAFFVSQIVLRLPVLQVLSLKSAPFAAFVSTTAGKILIGAFTAGLFEETARLICARFILKGDKRSLKQSIAFGLGHGTCEDVILIGVTMLTYVIYMTAINNGTFVSMFYVGGDPAGPTDDILLTMNALSDQLTSIKAGDVYLGIAERVFAMTYHVFASVLIFKGVRAGKSIQYWLAAVAAHTVFNGLAVIMPNVWLAEGAIFILAAGAAFYIIHELKNESK